MNRKQLILLLLVMAVIGAAGLVLLQRNKESWAEPGAKMGDKVLPNFQPNDVEAIHIKGGSDLNIVHEKDVWRVKERSDYPANFHQISDILIKLKGLKVVEAETVDPSELPRVNLDEPGKGSASGTLVEFKNGQGKVLTALLLGKKHMHERSELSHSPIASEPDGRYILLPGDPKVVLLISDALGALQPNPQAWLDKDFFKVEKMKSISLAATNAANSWQVARAGESSPWVLLDSKPGEALDSNKIAAIVHTISSPAFIDITSAAPAETGLDKPAVATIETFDHFAYTLKVGAKSPDGKYCMTVAAAKDETPDDRKKLDRELQEKLAKEQALAPWVYIVGSWILDPLLSDRARILQGGQDEKAADAAEPAKPAAPAKPAIPTVPGWAPHVIQ